MVTAVSAKDETATVAIANAPFRLFERTRNTSY